MQWKSDPFTERLNQCAGGPWYLNTALNDPDDQVIQLSHIDSEQQWCDPSSFLDFLDINHHRRLLRCLIGRIPWEKKASWPLEILMRETRPPSLEALEEAFAFCYVQEFAFSNVTRQVEEKLRAWYCTIHSGQSAHPTWSWKNRVADIAALQQEQGGATTVKMTLIGRPGRISNKGTFILTTMQSSKVPALPKGLPVPTQASTTYAVYIAQKQWRKVEEALRNPGDILIAEGYPMLDQETGTIAVFVSNATTKFLQAAQREKQRAEA